MPGLPFSYSIRRSPRATRTRIIVTTGKIEVVAPPQVAEHKLHQFVSDKQQWIMSALNKVVGQQPEPVSPVFYREGVAIAYQGAAYKLGVLPSKLKRVKISFADTLIAHVPESLPATEHSDAIKTALTHWMKQQARLQVEQRVRQHAGKKQLMPRSVIIKTQKSRWGSCGIHNDININWLLIMAPPEVLEYVVVHELCHIKVRNHSARFWQLVAEHLPDFHNQRLWLKQHGGHLMRGL
ncbi:MAG: SprT family zinc-dependent metalloprotease [Methylovulum sp.]|nr:SprT family zinc-dependent metalloprotease [Methylovulum sp.]